MKRYNTFLKGVLMGTCDIIPGISAGTIAFVTGIYERLINAIKSFSLPFLYDLVLLPFRKEDERRFRDEVKKLELGFLLTLGAGILTAIFLLSRVMSFLLEDYFVFTMVFFVGLILASAKTIFEHIERHHNLNSMVGLIGLVIGISFVLFIPVNVEPSLPYVFLGGFLAISAMLLPGVSGAFVLLVLGLYEFVLGVINNLFSNLNYAIVFALGAVGGMYVMSRVISFLFRKDKSKTLYLLLGLVIGSLSVPLRGIFMQFDVYGLFGWIGIVLLFVLGIVSARVVAWLARKRN